MRTDGADGGMLVAAADIRARLAGGDGRYAVLFDRDGVTCGFYTPPAADDQKPHQRDELYMVAAGTGTFVMGDRRIPFGPGDLIFVPAGMIHRFEDYTPGSLAVWVVFYGERKA